MLLTLATIAFGLISCAQAHGDHSDHGQQPMAAPDAGWASWHMAEEHHMSSFDAGAFFTLHDYDSTNEWTREDILKTYGLMDESTDHIKQADKDIAVQTVIALYDKDNSGTISHAEFVEGDAQGIRLPDFGFGPGHHGDYEYEYEIHHFEKFHGPDTTLEDLTHPEDIEHFRRHEQMEAEEAAQQSMDHMAIIEANIPPKFRRNG